MLLAIRQQTVSIPPTRRTTHPPYTRTSNAEAHHHRHGRRHACRSAVASADVPRYQTQDATFTVTTPSGAGGLWTTDYKVTNNPCDDTFTGKGVVNGLDYDGEKTFDEDVKGTFNSDGTVSLTASRDPHVSSWSLSPTLRWTVPRRHRPRRTRRWVGRSR